MTDSEKRPLFSIITPARNLEGVIGATIRSLQEQTCTDWECIVVDDASTDGTVREVEAFRDNRIRIIAHEQRQGVSGGRNTAMAAARGTFLVFLDGDDLLFPRSLQRFADAFANNPEAAVLYGEVQMLKEDGSPAGKVKRSLFHPRPSGDILPALLKRNLIVTGALAVRTAAARQSGNFNTTLPIAEDWEYWCRLAAEHLFVYLGGGAIAGYRIRENSASRSGEHSPETGLAAVDTLFSNPLIVARMGEKKCASLKREAQASVYEYAANHYLRTKRWQEARQLLRKSIALAGSRPRPLILLFFARLGFLPAAIKKRLK